MTEGDRKKNDQVWFDLFSFRHWLSAAHGGQPGGFHVPRYTRARGRIKNLRPLSERGTSFPAEPNPLLKMDISLILQKKVDLDI